MSTRKIIVLVLLISIASIHPATAQSDPCSKEAVIASFAEASADDSVDAWLTEYVNGDCSDATKAGVQALADAYTLLDVPPEGDEAPSQNLTVPYVGDYPVLRTVNALGVERTIEVWPGTMEYLVTPGVVIGTRLSEFRYADATTVTLADGQVIAATLIAIVRDPNNQTTYELEGMTEVELMSLAASTESESPAELVADTWTLHITSPIDMTFTGDNPRWSFSYYSSEGYLIGGETHIASSDDFYLTVEGQAEATQVFFDDFSAYAYSSVEDPYSLALNVTTSNGNQVVGTMGFEATDSKGDHQGSVIGLRMFVTNADRWVFFELGYSDRPIAFTLTKN